MLTFDDIIGNERIKIQLQIASGAAKIRNTSVPHVLFTGAAGCGKTTMSKALAQNQEAYMLKIPPESIRTSQDVLDIGERLSVEGYNQEGEQVGPIKPTILFLDEVHKMPIGGQEALGIAMEEWYVATKNKYTGESFELWLPKFTVVGATTLLGKLSKPFRDRFKMLFQFSTYNLEDSINIVKKHAEIKHIKIDDDAAKEIARRARGVPRVMVSFLERAHDTVMVMGDERITKEATDSVFNFMEIDETGLERNDIKLLMYLYQYGIPVGLDTLVVLINESAATIQFTREPYLIRQGLILKTGKGRLITKKGIDYLKEHNYVKNTRAFAR